MKSNSKTVKSKKSTRKQTLKGGWAQHGSNARFPTGTTSVTTHNNIQTSGATSNAKPIEHIEINSDLPMNKPMPPYIPPKQPEPEKPTHGLGHIDAGIHLPTPRDLKDVKVVHGKSDMVYPSAASQPYSIAYGQEKPVHGLGHIDAGIHLPTPRDLKDVKVVRGKSDMVYPSAASQNDVTQYLLSRKQNSNNFGWAIRDINSLNGKKSKKPVKKQTRKNKMSYLENSVRNMF